MTPNILISQTESEVERHFGTEFIAHIDGQTTLTLRKFYEELADLLEIPDAGYTLDSLNDSLNDLQWLDEKRIVLYFTNTTELISRERDPAKMGSVLNILDACAEDWKWTDDNESLDQKELIIVFEDSPRIREMLEKESINYVLISSLK